MARPHSLLSFVVVTLTCVVVACGGAERQPDTEQQPDGGAMLDSASTLPDSPNPREASPDDAADDRDATTLPDTSDPREASPDDATSEPDIFVIDGDVRDSSLRCDNRPADASIGTCDDTYDPACLVNECTAGYDALTARADCEFGLLETFEYSCNLLLVHTFIRSVFSTLPPSDWWAVVPGRIPAIIAQA